MNVVTTKQALRAAIASANARSVGFVPTMGYLHDGHLSLVNAAIERADAIVVSIYVNPAQFAANEDFGTYPRDSEGDLAKLRALGVHAVFNQRRCTGAARRTGTTREGHHRWEAEKSKKTKKLKTNPPPHRHPSPRTRRS